MNYQRVIVAGNATEDAQQRKAKKSNVAFVTFSIAVQTTKDQTTFFPVMVFGKYGDTVARYITRGRQLLVEGRIETRENGRFNLIADQVRFGPEPGKKDSE